MIYYNRVHKTLKVSPAMAAGVTDRLWDIADIVMLTEKAEAAPEKARAVQEGNFKLTHYPVV